MAVRDALLALLTMGPAYGFALHGGLSERTGGRRSVNVGQTYATLDRLTKQNLVESAGSTDDGLPLHRLTDAGRSAAETWLGGADASGSDPWDETVDRVLIASSIPGFDAASVIDREIAGWSERRDASRARAEAAGVDASLDHPLVALAALADVARAESAIAWLHGSRDLGGLSFEPSAERPRRGRRPGRTASAPTPAPGGPEPEDAPAHGST